MWGPKVRKGRELTCHQCTSFAGHSFLGGLQLPLRLDDGLPDVLHHEVAGGKLLMGALLVRLRHLPVSDRTTEAHPPCLSPAVLGQAGLLFSTQFVKCISQLCFCLNTQAQTQTHRNTNTLASFLGTGRPGFFTLVQHSRVDWNLFWQKKTVSIHPCFFFCPLPLGSKHKVSQQ